MQQVAVAYSNLDTEFDQKSTTMRYNGNTIEIEPKTDKDML